MYKSLCKAYVREYPSKIWPYMVQYLHFRILEFPLTNSYFWVKHSVNWNRGHRWPVATVIVAEVSHRLQLITDTKLADDGTFLNLATEMPQFFHQTRMTNQ